MLGSGQYAYKFFICLGVFVQLIVIIGTALHNCSSLGSLLQNYMN